MIFTGAAAILAIGVAAPSANGAPPPSAPPQMTIRRQIIIRSVRLRPAPQISGRIEWREERGVKCLAARSIAGASQFGQSSVDLILRNGTRIRARMSNACPALDYYYGFYISPGDDGFVCADRETIRSRAGGQCEIDSFRLLRPVVQPLTTSRR